MKIRRTLVGWVWAIWLSSVIMIVASLSILGFLVYCLLVLENPIRLMKEARDVEIEPN